MPEFTPQLIEQTLNITFFVIIGTSILTGLLRGLYKSLFSTILSTIFLVVGFFLIPMISEMMLDFNFSMLNQFLPSEYHISTLRVSLPEILANLLPNQAAVFVAGTDTMALVFGVVKFVFSIVLLIVLLLLNATIFKIITGIIWLFIRPKKNKKTDKKPKKHRILGGVVGLVKGFVAAMIIGIPIAGLASFSNSAFILQDAIEFDSQAALDDEAAILEAFQGYRTSLLGRLYSFTVDDVNFDEYLFDAFVKIDVKTDDKVDSLKLRQEFAGIAEIFAEVVDANEGSLEFDQNILFKLTAEQIDLIQNNLNKSNIINVAKNVGAEIAFEMLKDDYLEGYEEYITLELIKAIDLKKDISTLIGAVKIINQSEAKEELFENVFALTEIEAENLINKLAELETLKIGLPVAVNFFFEMEEMKDLMLENDIDINDIVRPDADELIADFKNIVNIYALAKEVGFTSVDDFENAGSIDFFVSLEDKNITDLFETVFAFSFLYNNNEFFATVVHDMVIDDLPDELKDFLTKERISDNFNAAELGNVVLLAKVLAEAEMFEDNINYDKLFSETSIEKLSTYISKSDLLSDGTIFFIDMFIGADEVDFELVVPEDLTFKGEAGKTELIAVLNSAKNIVDLGLLESVESFTAFTEEQIDDISSNFSASKLITHNLSNLINTMLKEQEFEFESNETAEFWTKTEIYHTLSGINVIIEAGIEEDDFSSFLVEDKIDKLALSVSSSNTLSSNIGNILESMFNSFSDTLTIELPEDISFKYEDGGEDELKAILYSAKNIVDYNFLDSEDIFGDLTNEQIAEMALNFSSSKVISHNIPILINSLGDNQEIGFTIEVPEDLIFYGNEGEVELNALFKALKDIDKFKDGLDALKAMSNPEIEAISENFSKSRIVAHNISGIIDSLSEEQELGFTIEVPEDLTFYGEPGEVELNALFKSLKDIDKFEGGLDSIKSMTNLEIETMSENFSSSKVVSHNIPGIIDSINDEVDLKFAIEVPEDLTFYGNEGEVELNALFKSLKDIDKFEGGLDSIKGMTNPEIETMSENFASSKVVSHNIPGIIDSINDEVDLKFAIEVPENAEFYGEPGETELNALFKSLKDIDRFEGGLDSIKSMTNPEIETMSENFANSKVVSHNIPGIIESINEEENLSFTIEVPETTEFYGEPGKIELSALFKSLKDVDKFDDGLNSFKVLNDEEDIEPMSKNFSTSRVISHNLPAIIESVTKQGDDYQIEVPAEVEFYGEPGETELTALFKSLRDLSNIEDMDSFKALDDEEDIEPMSKNLSSSKIVAHNLPSIIDSFTDDSEAKYGFEITQPAGISYEGEAGEIELNALFKSLKHVDKLSGGLNSFKTLDDEEDIKPMSKHFSSSQVISGNIPTMIESVTKEGDDYQIEVPAEVEFYGEPGETELTALFKSLRDLSNIEDMDSFKALDDEADIEPMSKNLSSSKVVSHNLPTILDSFTDDSEAKYGFEIVQPDGISYEGEEGERELNALFKSLKHVDKLSGGLNSFKTLDDETDIKPMSKHFSSSQVISHNIPTMIESVTKEGDDYQIEVPTEVEFYGEPGESELNSLFKSLRDLSNIEDMDSFKNLDDETDIEPMSKNLSSSKVVSHNLPTIIDSFTDDSEAKYGFEIAQPAGISYEGEAGETELNGLFKSFRDITLYNISSKESFKALEDENIVTMSENFSSSKVITHNLTGITNSLTKGTSYDFVSVSEAEDPADYWSQKEIENTFKGVKIFADKDVNDNDLYNLENDEIHQIALSMTFANSISNLLEDKTKAGGPLENKLLIPDDLTYHSTETKTGEIEHLFMGLKSTLNGKNLDEVNLELSELKKVDLEEVFKSQILEATAVELHIKPLVKESLNKYLVDEYKDGTEFDWYMNVNENNPKGDTIGLVDSVKGLDAQSIDIENLNYMSFKGALSSEENIINVNDALLKSNILKASLYKMLNELLVNEGNLDVKVENPDDLSYWGTASGEVVENRGELFYILNALTIGDGFENQHFNQLDAVTIIAFNREVHKINASDTLRPIIRKMLDKPPLIQLAPFRYTPDQNKYKDPETFDQGDWEPEIDILTDIILIMNESVNPLFDIAALQSLALKMETSKLYDPGKVETYILGLLFP
ncbi:MAG: CvpA family protein [Acholeplasmataceae bacterium]|nr:CvpA family protein [Acholeplasmataceae bacterium]